MCGRYALDQNARALTDHFGLLEVPEFAPRYNITPATLVLGIRHSDRGRIGELMRWGLEPAWMRAGAGNRARPINARAENLAERPMFRNAFRSRRCLLPASGFYEWQHPPGGAKQPFYIRPGHGPAFAMAALYEPGVAGKPPTCCIVTTPANSTLAAIHDRMPAIVGPHDIAAWLDPEASRESLLRMLAPCPADWLVASPVSRRVNDVRNDGPALVEPLPASG